MSRSIAERTNRQHDRYLDQNTDDGRQRRSRAGAEQRDRRGNGEFKEIASADQRARSGNSVPHLEEPHQCVRE